MIKVFAATMTITQIFQKQTSRTLILILTTRVGVISCKLNNMFRFGAYRKKFFQGVEGLRAANVVMFVPVKAQSVRPFVNCPVFTHAAAREFVALFCISVSTSLQIFTSGAYDFVLSFWPSTRR